MQRAVRILASIAVVTACASRQGSTVGAPLVAPSSETYTCAPTRVLHVRIRGTSATIMVDNDGPFTLPQATSRADIAVYSDGYHTLQISRDQASYGVSRGQMRACSRG